MHAVRVQLDLYHLPHESLSMFLGQDADAEQQVFTKVGAVYYHYLSQLVQLDVAVVSNKADPNGIASVPTYTSAYVVGMLYSRGLKPHSLFTILF
jgi:hypothetical protein